MTQEGLTGERLNRPIAKTQGLVVRQLGDETLVYDLALHTACCLNSSAALIWEYCDGDHSVQDLVDKFEYDGHGEINEDFVWMAIDQLAAYGLVEHRNSGRVPSQSRRLMLKRIGLATVVVLPIISTLVVPQSALAHVSCVCTSPVLCSTYTFCPSTTNCNGVGLCAPN